MRGRQLQNGRLLTFAQPGQEHDLPIRKFECIVVCVRTIRADLTESGDLSPKIPLAEERNNRVGFNLPIEGDFGAGEQADGRVWLSDRRQAAGDRVAEI